MGTVKNIIYVLMAVTLTTVVFTIFFPEAREVEGDDISFKLITSYLISMLVSPQTLFGFIVGLLAFTIRNNRKKSAQKKYYLKHDITCPDNQLRFINDGSLAKKAIMNKSEVKVFYTLEDHFRSSSHRVMVQVNLGEFISSRSSHYRSGRQCKCADCNVSDKAFRSYNSKRVDFLVVDKHGMPRVVIEYQGSGHYLGNARARDTVKKLCFQKANIHLLEIPADYDPIYHDLALRRTIDSMLKDNIWRHYHLDTSVRSQRVA